MKNKFKTKHDVLKYITDVITDRGFKLGNKKHNYILGNKYFINVRLAPMIGEVWEIGLNKMEHNGMVIFGNMISRSFFAMDDRDKTYFKSTLDDALNYALNQKEIKLLLRQQKIKKLKKCMKV